MLSTRVIRMKHVHNNTISYSHETEFHEVPLIQIKQYNHDTKLLTFGLPEGVSLDLPVCACILLRGYDKGATRCPCVHLNVC